MRFSNVVLRVLGAGVAALLLSASAYSQGGDVGSIVGLVTDQSERRRRRRHRRPSPIAGESIARTLTADNAGQYAAPNLNSGTYKVRGEFQGIPEPSSAPTLLIEVRGTRFAFDLTLSTGRTTQPSRSQNNSAGPDHQRGSWRFS